MSIAELPDKVRRPATRAGPPAKSAILEITPLITEIIEGGQDVGSIAPVSMPAAGRLGAAVNHLKFAWPEMSAGWPVWAWQIWFATILLTSMAAAFVLGPPLVAVTVLAGLSLTFFCFSLLRIHSLCNGLRPILAFETERFQVPSQTDEELPDYTILVPLFGEAGIVTDLVLALEALTYPVSKLQVLIILEEADQATRDAILRTPLPAHFVVITVPPGQPQTKPRALNFALLEARGEYVTVFDAEDVPEPDQLQKAVAAFRFGPKNLACVQARLNVYNPEKSWLTRQFTIEYTMLFDWLLPGLQALDLPVPLGGTSNHFRKSYLVAAGGWDPFNVTEDADLGIRLARMGYGVSVLNSTTWEEAPHGPSAWMRQRTRWLKGWMQTYLVHTRQPLQLWRDLGAWRFWGLHALMGGPIVSALVHPWFYVLAAMNAWHGTLLQAPANLNGQLLWALGVFNLVSGYATAAGLGAIAVQRRSRPWLSLHTLIMPVYWLMISYAAYRALFQLVSAPYYWEKTEHTARTAQHDPAAGNAG
ncbi:MAG: glycosyltransferase [Hyphomicrobium sp.]